MVVTERFGTFRVTDVFSLKGFEGLLNEETYEAFALIKKKKSFCTADALVVQQIPRVLRIFKISQLKTRAVSKDTSIEINL